MTKKKSDAVEGTGTDAAGTQLGRRLLVLQVTAGAVAMGAAGKAAAEPRQTLPAIPVVTDADPGDGPGRGRGRRGTGLTDSDPGDGPGNGRGRPRGKL